MDFETLRGIIQINLTEQHRSGKLERRRDYFVKVNDKVVSIYLDGDNDFIYYGHIIKPEVLAAVPTYEEYIALLSDSLAKNEGVEINAELKAENKKLKEIIKFAIDGIRNITKNHRFTPISTAEILLKELRNKLK